jgi:hypothetical protein
LQLAHLADRPFEQWRSSIMLSTFTLTILTVLQYFFKFQINMNIFILGFLVFMLIGKFPIFYLLVYLHFAYYVSEEMCQILNIKRFTITPKIEQPKSKSNFFIIH